MTTSSVMPNMAKPTRSPIAVVAVVSSLAAGAAFALSMLAPPAHAQGQPDAGPRGHVAHAMAGGIMGGQFGDHMGGLGGGGMGRGMSRGLDRMLDSVSATDAQRTQIRQIAEAARTDLAAQRQAGQALRDRAMSAFTQPSVDARELEAVRQQMLAQHDTQSRRMTQAMLDISRVLTPEQRTQLAQRMKQHGGEMRQRMQERQRSATPTS